jgi:hypothetical protein
MSTAPTPAALMACLKKLEANSFMAFPFKFDDLQRDPSPRIGE